MGSFSDIVFELIVHHCVFVTIAVACVLALALKHGLVEHRTQVLCLRVTDGW